jgi:hypothetical protein
MKHIVLNMLDGSQRYLSFFNRGINLKAIPKIHFSELKTDAVGIPDDTAADLATTIRDLMASYFVNRNFALDYFAEAAGIQIVDPNSLQFVRLLKIVRLDRPSQTAAFRDHVDSWMRQWTVDANHQPMVTRDHRVALNQWRNEFVRSFRHAIPELHNVEDVSQDFEFAYYVKPIEEGRGFWLKDGARSIVLADIAAPKT